MQALSPGFADLNSQIAYVRQSLGMDDPKAGSYIHGNGWENPYEIYCVRCNAEINVPFIHDEDPKKTKRCPKCKEANECFTREERRKQLQEHMDLLKEEEETYRRRRKKFKKFRKKVALRKQMKDLDLLPLVLGDDYVEEDEDAQQPTFWEDDEEDYKDVDEQPLVSYKEHEMWMAKIDLDEYLDDQYYIPRGVKEVTDRAWFLHGKYQACKKQMDVAIAEKQKGNDAVKAGEYEAALKHYGLSMVARTDYKPSYNNRALVYMKLKQYDKCIMHCNYVIDMIENVDVYQKDDDVMFKAFLRRANAYKCKEDFEAARADLDRAAAIKPNDGAVKKLMKETKLLHKRQKLRDRLRTQCTNDINLNDFESVFNLSVEFLTEATETEEDFHFETGHSEELLRRLLIFLAKEKKYCVRFADHNGVELSLKYLRKKFKIIKRWKEKLPTLEKPFLLLNYCCEKDVNFNALKEKKLQKLIGVVVLYTFGYFGEMPEGLQSISMRFVAVVCSIAPIRDFVVSKHGSKLLAYFLKFQKKTNPQKQEAKALRCLFEAMNYLCAMKPFQALLVKQQSPFLYEVFMHSMIKYNESKVIKQGKDGSLNDDDRKALADYEQLQFCISVLLDALAMLFDSTRGGSNDGVGDQKESQSEQPADAESQALEKCHDEMMEHLLANKNLEKYMSVLSEYLHAMTRAFREHNNEEKESEQNRKDTLRYFGQVGKCLNLFVNLSKHEKMHRVLFQYPSIQKDVVSLSRVSKDPLRHRYGPKMVPLLKMCRNNILMYFDQLSSDKRFDEVFSAQFDNDADNEHAKKLPYFWTFICDVFVEEYKERPHPQLMQQFAHFKSCAIRLMYRWMCRRVEASKPRSQQQNKATMASKEEMEKYSKSYTGDGQKISYLMEMITRRYFAEICDWLKYNDLQVLANTPLVVRQMVIYAVNMKSARPNNFKLVKQLLTIQRLKDMMKLMQAPHEVIQYNACLLMATCQEADNELAATCQAMGATTILEGYKRMRKMQMQGGQAQSNNPAIGYK
eukprot:CAMPEP_0197036504 /NCGR_PEP_ID=MMETSP1384-20130603/13984_1 /TAXON_ID=29189 /ORGANISM="Ammonia sp." /LENGTH=1020 /DNA_ID=CAMNT_0042466689 /DNA_START=36 /DNA_END=3098 /DNA_ORIENTATION=+